MRLLCQLCIRRLPRCGAMGRYTRSYSYDEVGNLTELSSVSGSTNTFTRAYVRCHRVP